MEIIENIRKRALVFLAKGYKGEEISQSDLRCSFCGKAERDVKNLIAGPKAFICNECVSLCNQVIEEEKSNVE